MIFDIIMNNPGRYKYMSKSKETVSVCLINLGGGEKTYINRYPIFLCLWQKKNINDIMS